MTEPNQRRRITSPASMVDFAAATTSPSGRSVSLVVVIGALVGIVALAGLAARRKR